MTEPHMTYDDGYDDEYDDYDDIDDEYPEPGQGYVGDAETHPRGQHETCRRQDEPSRRLRDELSGSGWVARPERAIPQLPASPRGRTLGVHPEMGPPLLPGEQAKGPPARGRIRRSGAGGSAQLRMRVSLC